MLILALNIISGAWADESAPVAKRVLSASGGENLLHADGWRPWQEGFVKGQEGIFVCDNGASDQIQRGASQTVVLNQTTPAPIVATAWSRAEKVTGAADSDYSLYLDLVYTDGTPLWGQVATFSTGTHDWQRRQVVVVPPQPVRQVTLHLLLRRHGGKALFRDPELHVVETPEHAVSFDGVPCIPLASPRLGFQVRDVAADSDFVTLDSEALGLRIDARQSERGDAVFMDARIEDLTHGDRAVCLVYSVPIAGGATHWLHDPRTSQAVEPRREYLNASQFRGGGGRLSRYPLAAVAQGNSGWALAIDMDSPAFYRLGYNAATRELFLAYDLGLTPEQPTARVRFCHYRFDGSTGFRGAVGRYYGLFPEAFRCRTPEQGLWMPFAKISEVEGWQDFGFRFKEGNNETAWDDQQDIVTFRYTEPMTWWMPMPTDMPRTMSAALDEAKRLAEQGYLNALALFSSGYHDQDGQFAARLLDTPWCNGAVWSMNSMPGITGDVTDFRNQWNDPIRDRYYGPERKGDLDGEYIDSSEGYVTNELNFRRDHFAAAATPLTFAPDTCRVGIFRGLIAFEYIQGIARDVHGMERLMMANSTPSRLGWLAPLLDVMGTETNWNPGGHWRPMSDEELLFRRVMCKGKPFCFLMNTEFEQFPYGLVERYMKRSLAYGMFPGFFSHNASQGHYFTRPELYNRDRPLFKKYVPLCRLVAEAGWEPLTGAASSDPRVHLERFGDRYLTVFNDSQEPRTATIRLDRVCDGSTRELVNDVAVVWQDGQTKVTLPAEDVLVIELP